MSMMGMDAGLVIALSCTHAAVFAIGWMLSWFWTQER
jgi:hypothetical protein